MSAKPKRWTVVLGMICLVAAIGWAQPASVLLEKGIHAEETAGDLDEAIKTYQKIIDDAEADSKYTAEAHYRLGVCYLKKDQTDEAMAAFKQLVERYPDQTELVAKATKRVTEARKALSPQQVAEIVTAAVTTISTCAENDPQIKPAMATLAGLDEKTLIKELDVFLGSEKATFRRSAIYILWKAELSDIGPAVPTLMKLCEHEEALTRGMAALALGRRKVETSFEKLCDMALKDSSPYARRCAAYALGLLGDKKAKSVLKKAAKDSDELVRNNAEAAMTMLSGVKGPPKIVATDPPVAANDVDPSRKTLSVTFDQVMMDKHWSWVQNGGRGKYPESIGKPSYDRSRKTCSVPVKLEPGQVYWIEFNSPPYLGFRSTAGTVAKRGALVFATKSADGKATPIPAKLIKLAEAINADDGVAPIVTQTFPKVFDNKVEPATKEITAFFSKEMKDGCWSWVQRYKDKYPKTTGKPSFDETMKACSIPVELEPGKVYWIEINSPPYDSFQSTSGRKATRYALVFATASADGKPTRIPRDLLAKARKINGPTSKALMDKATGR